MTRFKIQKMKFFVFLLTFLLAQTVHCDGSFREKRPTPTIASKNGIKSSGIDEPAAVTSARKTGDQQDAVESSSVDAKARPDSGNRTLEDVSPRQSVSDVTAVNKTVHTNTSDEHSNASFNTGALMRGFVVFVVLSILVMAYIMFRSFSRLSTTRAQMVRKYGVLTHRQDVEMRPLPLEEEDDEDTTVFDASNVLTNNVQHQNT